MKNFPFSMLISLALLLGTGSAVTAQYKTTIPLDPSVRMGQLKNGMTYYVRHNEEPKERVSFYFVQNVGAILEQDNQNGLAHFLEHMSFNGTQNFKGKGIINYLEKYGVKFGRNINAYTSLDETVYNLSDVPVGNQGLLDSCLLVLHDWSGYLLLEDDEIDAERGVIHEEWRTRRTPQFRISSQTRKVFYKDSKYAKRDVIGDLDVIDNFDYKVLRDYYKMWYRPDQQAVVVVGDIDVDAMEKNIKQMFSSIPMRENLPERNYFEVPSHDETLYCIAKDKEAKRVSIEMLFLKDPVLVKDENYRRNGLIKSMFSSMINNRYQELLRKPESAGVSMGVGFGSMTRTKAAFYMSVSPKEKQSNMAFQQLMVEMERATRHGFTSSELERTKVQFLRSYESYYKERDKISNDQWCKELQNHFLKASPVPSVEQEYEFAKKVIPSITLKEVNDLCGSVMTPNNRVMVVTGPEKEGMDYPSQGDLIQIIDRVHKMKIAAYEDGTTDTPLIDQELKGSGVKSTFNIKNLKAKGVVLNNGVRIVILPTEYSKDEILCSAFSWGGSSLLNDQELASANAAVSLVNGSGVGDFDAIKLRKKLAGKLASISPYISSNTEGFKGSASAKDLETLLQLTWLKFQKPRFDKQVFKTQMASRRNKLVNLSADNSNAFRDSVVVTKYAHHPRLKLFGEKFLDEMDFEQAKTIYKQRISNAGDFTFVFVGNIDVKTALPLMDKYLGSLPSTGVSEKWVNHHMDTPKGVTVNEFPRQMQTPKVTAYYSLSGKLKYNIENSMMMKIVSELLNKRYLETIREKEGGSYGVGVWPSVSRIPEQKFGLSISFDCDPNKKVRLLQIVDEEIQKLAHQGPVAEDLDKIKKNLLKNRSESMRTNGFWLSLIKQNLMDDQPILTQSDYEQMVSSFSEKRIKNFAKKIFKKTDIVKVVMVPSEDK